MRVVDAHAHLWDVDIFPVPWWRPELGLHRRYAAEDLRRAQRGVDIEGRVLVQAAHTAREGEWLREQARSLGAVVVEQREPHTADAPDAIGRTGPLVRLSLAGCAVDWSHAPGVEQVLNTGSVVELLCRPDQLGTAAEVAARHPRITFVLDHLGLGGAEPDAEWLSGIREFAARSNAAAKVSGILRGHGDQERARAALVKAGDAFGPERLMFGSDWPMSSPWGTVEQLVTRVDAMLPSWSVAEVDSFWSGTAEKVYCGPQRHSMNF